MAEDLDQFGLVLEESLRLLQEAGEPVDAILLRFPAWADQLRPRLLTASWLGSNRQLYDPNVFRDVHSHLGLDYIHAGSYTYRFPNHPRVPPGSTESFLPDTP